MSEDVDTLLFKEDDLAVDFFDEPFIACASATILLHADHLDDLAASRDKLTEPVGLLRAIGRVCGLIFSAKMAMTFASIASVLASLPSARAKSLI